MSQIFVIHPDNPQKRLIGQAAGIVENDGVIAYPTDSLYALGCRVGNKAGLERIRAIRQVSPRHNFTLVCRDLAEIATYAQVSNAAYRLIKALTPGPYTFILKATHEAPRIMQHPKRKTIGIRVPGNHVAHALLVRLNEPLMSSTLLLPGDEFPISDPEVVQQRIGKQLDLVIDGGPVGMEPTTVVDLVDDRPVLIRVGRGDASVFDS